MSLGETPMVEDYEEEPEDEEEENLAEGPNIFGQ